jgi:hypothetical protein
MNRFITKQTPDRPGFWDIIDTVTGRKKGESIETLSGATDEAQHLEGVAAARRALAPPVQKQGTVVIVPTRSGAFRVLTPDGKVEWFAVKAQAFEHAKKWFAVNVDNGSLGLGVIEWCGGSKPPTDDEMKVWARTYRGSYTSALVRCRKVLAAAGVPLSKKSGRYSPFASTQKFTTGVTVHRLGVSDTVALHATVSNSRGEPLHDARSSAEARALEARALAVLRDAGLQFDDRLFLECVRGPR